jgi:phosphoribosyl 1,2-cyclic phosphodiesterase
MLIDAGLSPRRTRRLLGEIGLGLDSVSHIVLTHLDSDHWYRTWPSVLPSHITVLMHRRHLGRAARDRSLMPHRTEPLDDDCSPMPGVNINPVLMAHDSLGVAAFRFTLSGTGGRCASLGFATDLGRATKPLIDHLHRVDVLAIESNYCPRLQLASDRPAFLKNRIMGGAGHLSNEQCAEAVTQIQPAGHVVFLHLSRQCNDPALVADLHRDADYGYTIANQHAPTRWIPIDNAPIRTTPARPTLFPCTQEVCKTPE